MRTDLKLTIGEIRMLAEQERRMDSGEQPYVFDKNRNRWSVRSEVMEELGLESGQQVSDPIITAIVEANLAVCQTMVALEKASTGNKADG